MTTTYKKETAKEKLVRLGSTSFIVTATIAGEASTQAVSYTVQDYKTNQRNNLLNTTLKDEDGLGWTIPAVAGEV